jgi:hypothetical protein
MQEDHYAEDQMYAYAKVAASRIFGIIRNKFAFNVSQRTRQRKVNSLRDEVHRFYQYVL